MAMPKPVSRKLQAALGDDAGGVMVEWLEELEETSRGTRTELAELRAAIAKLGEDMRLGFATVDVRFAQLEGTIAQFEAKLDGLADRTEKDIAKVSERTAQQIADTLKWVVPVWLASFGAIMGLMTWLTRGPR